MGEPVLPRRERRASTWHAGRDQGGSLSGLCASVSPCRERGVKAPREKGVVVNSPPAIGR